MTILGFNFTKISAEKKGSTQGKVNINNGIRVIDVAQTEMNLGKSTQKMLKYTFEFKSVFNPDIGEIVLVGDLMEIRPDNETADIMAVWARDRKLKKEIMEQILNTVLNKCNIQALIMARDLNLPSPVPLPSVQKNTTVAAKPAGKK
jgi:hypothetical protein